MHRAWMIQSISRQMLAALMCCMALLLGQALAANAQETARVVEPGKLGRFEAMIDKAIKERTIPGLDLKLYGFVDASYTQNFNNPNSKTNQLRIFDKDSNSFRPHLAQIVLEKEGKTSGTMDDRAGFRVKLNFGNDAGLIGGDGDDADFQEAYVQYVAPLGNGLDLRFGRMNTLIGYEVIESPYNPNFSRSWLFGFGQPFTTTGVRASYDFNENVSFALGAINSFNGSTTDANNSKSLESALSLTLTDQIALTLYGFWGPEGGVGDQDADILLAGGILDAQLTDKAEVVVEAYYGNQANGNRSTVFTNPVTSPAGNTRWGGVAGYVIYDFTDKWGVRLRGEIFEDAGGGLTGTAQTLWEMTYTLQYKPVPSLITRFEFRYDKSDANVFQDGATLDNNQQTLAVEAIYLF